MTLVEGIWQLHCGRRNLRYNGDRVTQLVARCGWPDAFAQLVASQSSTSSQQSNSSAALLSCTLRRSNGFLISKTCRLSGTNVLCFCNALKAHISSKNGVSKNLLLLYQHYLMPLELSLCLLLGLCVLGFVFWVCISVSSYTCQGSVWNQTFAYSESFSGCIVCNCCLRGGEILPVLSFVYTLLRTKC